MRTEPSERLKAIWARIPDSGCKGLCQEACGPIGASDEELALLRDRGITLRSIDELIDVFRAGEEPWDCPALVDGRCSVYEVRPVICRLWSSVEGMPCPHGCKPPFGMLTDEVGRSLIADADALR